MGFKLFISISSSKREDFLLFLLCVSGFHLDWLFFFLFVLFKSKILLFLLNISFFFLFCGDYSGLLVVVFLSWLISDLYPPVSSMSQYFSWSKSPLMKKRKRKRNFLSRFWFWWIGSCMGRVHGVDPFMFLGWLSYSIDPWRM